MSNINLHIVQKEKRKLLKIIWDFVIFVPLIVHKQISSKHFNIVHP